MDGMFFFLQNSNKFNSVLKLMNLLKVYTKLIFNSLNNSYTGSFIQYPLFTRECRSNGSGLVGCSQRLVPESSLTTIFLTTI